MKDGNDGYDVYIPQNKDKIITEKQKYIGAFLDGYFHDKELDYNLLYFKIREKAEKKAKNKWKKYKRQKI